MGTEAAALTMPERRAAHIVLLASPGAGHILPVAELARRIVAHGGGGAEFTATLVTYANFSSADHNSTLASLPASVSTAVLPEVPLDDLPANARVETRIFTVAKRSLPRLRDLLCSLLESPSGVAAFVPDLLGPWAHQVARELGVPSYLFCTTNLMALSCMLHVPELDRTTTCEFRDLPVPVRLPGCVPLRGADLLDPIQDRSDPAYRLMIEFGNNHLLADGFIVNTFDAIEHKTLVAFKELSDRGVYPPAYAVGPFVRPCAGGEATNKHGCLRWLDEQPDVSVLFVCLGSGGTLSTEQTAELAAGLEASGQRFLWVVRFPSDKDRSASFFGTAGHGDDPLSYLPEGFIERTKGVGLCLPLWAPQVEILNHRAVGGFLSHCGWNSTLEAATVGGVPMVAWPLYAEQRMNAVMLSERAGLALRPSESREDGVVPREEVAAVVSELIAGEKGAAARDKARELRAAAAKAWAPDGPSRRAFEAVVGKWKQLRACGRADA